MPLTKDQKDQLNKFMAADRFFGKALNKEVADQINQKVGSGEKADIGKINAYKPHTEEQIAALYTPEMKELQKKAGNILLLHNAMAKAGYMDSDGYEKHPLNRMANYEIDPSFAALGDDKQAEKDEIHQKNRKKIEELKQPEKVRALRNMVSEKLLKTDFSPLYSGDMKTVIDFLENNMYICEYAKETKQLISLFEKDEILLKEQGKQLDEQEKNDLAELKKRQNELVNFGGFAEAVINMVSNEYYPLLKGTGFEYHTNEVGVAVQNETTELENLPDEVQSSIFGLANAGSGMTTMLDLKKDTGEALSGEEIKQANAAAESIRNQRYGLQAAELLAEICGLDQKTMEEMLRNGELKISATDFQKNIKYDPKRGAAGYVTDLLNDKNSQLQYVTITCGGESLDFNLAVDGNTGMLSPTVSRGSVTPIADAAIERLKELETELTSAGTTINDSPEYTTMNRLLQDLNKELVKLNGDPKPFASFALAKKMEKLTKAADDYYYAKLDEQHNSRRSRRFNVAREIREIASDLRQGRFTEAEKREKFEYRKNQLKRDLIVEYLKTEALTNCLKLPDRKAQKETMQQIRTDLVTRKAIYEKAERILNPDRRRSPAEESQRMNLNHIFNGKTLNQLQEILNAKGGEIYKLVQQDKQAMKDHPLANVSMQEDDAVVQKKPEGPVPGR